MAVLRPSGGGERLLNIAHRGFKGSFPENTMLAFEKALEAGADGIEFDVHLARDGEVVIIHDERVDRTTNGTGRVQDHTSRELAALNAAALYPELPPQGVPTLRDYFGFVRDRDVVTNVELKTGVYWYEGIEDRVYGLIREFGLRDRIIVSSFNHRSIMRMKALDPAVVCGLLVDCWLLNPADYVGSLGVECYHPSVYGLHRKDVEELHRRGIRVNPWFLNEPRDFAEVVGLGIDGIITDYPDVIRALKESSGQSTGGG